MAQMRPTIKAFVSQACLRSFVVLLWETLDDNTVPLNAVLKRSYKWSSFYNALPWIGSRSALTIAKLSLDQSEPLGAFDWLKELRVMKLHDKWRSNKIITPCYIPESTEIINRLHQLLSTNTDQSAELARGQNSTKRLSVSSSNIAGVKSVNFESSDTSGSTLESVPSSGSLTPIISLNEASIFLGSLGWMSLTDTVTGQALSISPNGLSYDYLGCFPLGMTITKQAFSDVVQCQRRLKDMKLLKEIQYSVLHGIGGRMNDFCADISGQYDGKVFEWLAAMQELANQLSIASLDSTNSIRVYIGLDQGFQIQPGAYFWGVYLLDEDLNLNIFLSRNVPDITGAILHTFLSSRGCPRHACFLVEALFSGWSKDLLQPSGLPLRVHHDITLLSPTELLRFIQCLKLSSFSGDISLVRPIIIACETQLLEGSDFTQLKETSTSGFLSGRASGKDLIKSRISWYRQNGCHHPSLSISQDNFFQVHVTVTEMLKKRKIKDIQRITDELSTALQNDKIDARIDLIAISIFCAMRKHAFDETYMEVTDRNTLFNDQTDQAAAFAELFATGARCEAYFDVTPNVFGKLLSDRYRAYHHSVGHEPPIWSDLEPSTPSAYAAAKIDVDPNSNKSAMSAHQRFTFLSVFAFPALLDIILLTTTGRGLYLSGYMSHDEQHSATLALMISLLVSSAVGTWITCGGSYYLISMAFSAMNMFVLTRLIGGLAFTLAIATIGLVAVGATDGIVAGIIFFLYMIALTSYLCLLATLANFQYPGSAFQSGRPIIIMVVPFLFISPIITVWIPDKDIYIYLSVIYTFLILLVLGVRYTGSRWTTWYLNIEKLTDQQLREWYIETEGDADKKVLSGMTDPAVLKIARAAMVREVTAARKTFRWEPRDPLVSALAKSYDATIFLLEWYSGYSGTPLPMPYSSTWNMQTKVALQTLKQLQTGTRLHNAFIHWRQAGDEVGCSILYFIVALLDKWSSLFDGNQLLGLSALNTKYRMPVGFALAYYLIGAVLLDFNAAKLHTMTSKGQNMPIRDVLTIPQAIEREVRARRSLYWTMLGRYTLLHVWSLAVASSLLWVFDSTMESTILFISYVGAYTGLLWYQYTKIFAGPRSLKPLLAAVTIGLPLGQILRHYYSGFMYCDTVTLATATWTAAILSLYYARIKMKSIHKAVNSPGSKQAYSKLAPEGDYHAFCNPGKDPLLSQDELRIVFHNLRALRLEERYQVNPQNNLGLEIKTILLHALGNLRDQKNDLSTFALEAFPEALELLERAIFAFECGDIIIDCVSMVAMSDTFANVKAISHFLDGHLYILAGCEMMDTDRGHFTVSGFCHSTAEIIVHAVAETLMSMSHDDACLVESLIALPLVIGREKHLPVPSRIKDYLTHATL